MSMTDRAWGSAWRWAVIVAFCASTSSAIGDGAFRPDDNHTFRPTVIVLRGTSQGSGTVIASVPGETLVLTAAHVLEAGGQAFVEVHRYNLALENKRSSNGWPKKVPAKVVATDPAADVAILRLEGFQAMPFVAKVTIGPDEPELGTGVISVGVDRGAKLSSWPTKIIEHASIDMEKGGGVRPFLLTTTPPDFGRSGGGLFATDGRVVGVCVGRAEPANARRVGIFASTASIHRILREHHLDTNVARSVARRLPKNPTVERTKGTVPAPPEPTPPPPAPRLR
jgi:S1-C subfamily serine protease